MVSCPVTAPARGPRANASSTAAPSATPAAGAARRIICITTDTPPERMNASMRHATCAGPRASTVQHCRARGVGASRRGGMGDGGWGMHFSVLRRCIPHPPSLIPLCLVAILAGTAGAQDSTGATPADSTLDSLRARLERAEEAIELLR